MRDFSADVNDGMAVMQVFRTVGGFLRSIVSKRSEEPKPVTFTQTVQMDYMGIALVSSRSLCWLWLLAWSRIEV